MLLDAAPGFLPMLQFVDAEENADDRVFGNVSRFQPGEVWRLHWSGNSLFRPALLADGHPVQETSSYSMISSFYNDLNFTLAGCQARMHCFPYSNWSFWFRRMAARRLMFADLQFFVLLQLYEKCLDYGSLGTLSFRSWVVGLAGETLQRGP